MRKKQKNSEAKEIISNGSGNFCGTNSDSRMRKLARIAVNAFYKYKCEPLCETLMKNRVVLRETGGVNLVVNKKTKEIKTP